MARYTGPVCKLCRREGEKLFLKGSRCVSPKCAIERRNYPPGQHGRDRSFGRGRASDYSLQLREKQKVRRIYGVLERQFRRYYREALKSTGLTGSMILQLLERRLDNTVYRMGFADSRAQARQLVSHGHFAINGRRINVPSYQVRIGDEVSVRDGSRGRKYFKMLREGGAANVAPQWVTRDINALVGEVTRMPEREDIEMSINEQLVVEYYSR